MGGLGVGAACSAIAESFADGADGGAVLAGVLHSLINGHAMAADGSGEARDAAVAGRPSKPCEVFGGQGFGALHRGRGGLLDAMPTVRKVQLQA